MDLMITVSTARSSNILEPLLRACVRCGCSWKVFLTHKGVEVLNVPGIAEILVAQKDNAIACHDSWQRYGASDHCPVTEGSQTNHSEMAGSAVRVISL